MATTSNSGNLFDSEITDMLKQYRSGGPAPTATRPVPPTSTDNPMKIASRKESDYPKHFKPMSKVFGFKPEGGVDLPIPVFKPEDWHEDVRIFIPTAEEMKGYVPYPKLIEKFVCGMYHEDRILLHGPTGPGKSTLPKFICSVLNIPFLVDNGHTEKEKSEFIGMNTFKIDPTTGKEILEAEDTSWTLAFKHGGMLVYDEAFRTPPGVNMVIQAALEKGGSLILQDAANVSGADRKLKPPASKFWFILTDNSAGTGDTTGNYMAQVQDVSTLDRITSTIKVDYLPIDYEVEIIRANEPSITEDQAYLMVDLARIIRSSFNNSLINQTMSVRGLLSWSSKAVTFGCVKRGYVLAFHDKLATSEERALSEEMFHQIYAVNLEE